MMSVKLATLESERTRTSGQSGDTLKYWWCEQPFCLFGFSPFELSFARRHSHQRGGRTVMT
jgi:hypothetical protein